MIGAMQILLAYRALMILSVLSLLLFATGYPNNNKALIGLQIKTAQWNVGI